MPSTQVPPDQGTFSAYYREIATHNWYVALTDEGRSVLNAIKIEANLHGQCSCGRLGELYTISVHDVSSVSCKRCYKRKLINMSIEVLTVYQTVERMPDIDSEMFPFTSLPLHTDSRPTCIGCHELIFQVSDHDVSSRISHSEQVEHEQETVSVHSACAWSCVDCTQSYITAYINPHVVNGSTNLCTSCLDSRVEAETLRRCDWCNRYNADTHYSSTRDRELCERCLNSDWSCDDCGHEVREGDDHECYRNRNSLIYDYSYKPQSPRFFGEADYHFGLEIEVEDIEERGIEQGAKVVLDALDDRVYIKHDSSLNDGFEIVSEPHSFNELENLNWDFLRTLRSRGYRSWDTNTCGIHVHVSRTAFRNAGKHNEAHELRFQKLIYDNANQVRTIAGRSSSYAQFQDKGNLVMKVKHGQSADRYEAINSQNTATLEVRVFRGSLKKHRILSAVEFIHSAVEYTRFMKIDPKAKQLSWFRFMGYVLDNQDKYSNFTQIALKDVGTNPNFSTEMENA